MANRFALLSMSLLAALGGLSAVAQTNTNGTNSVNTITTAVPFLRISPDARSGAMGDVGIAISPDANSQYWNVGKMPFATKKYGIGVTYTPWLKDLVPDIFLAYISGYAKFGTEDNQAISGSLRYFSLGDITYTQDGINATGIGRPREFSLDLGYSRKLSPYLSLGIGLRYIHSAIINGAGGTGVDLHPGNTVAGDVGLYYTKTKEIDEYRSRNFSFGATITNLGGKISYTSLRKDFIPINLGLGIAYTAKVDEYNKITFAVDVNKLLVPTPQDTNTDATKQPAYIYPEKTVVSGVLGSFSDAPAGEELRELQFSAGLEYWYQDQFAVRAGYFYEDKTKGDRKYFTVGIGARYSIFGINAAYLVPSGSGINRNPLSNTVRISLNLDFDKLQKSEGTSE